MATPKAKADDAAAVTAIGSPTTFASAAAAPAPPPAFSAAPPSSAVPSKLAAEGIMKAMKTTEDMVAFGQGNFEAALRSGQIWVTGLQDMGKQFAATAQAQIAQTAAAFEAITSAKSVKDAVDVQAGYARATVEKALAESGKLAEASVKLTERTLAPLTQRWAAAVEEFSRTGA